MSQQVPRMVMKAMRKGGKYAETSLSQQASFRQLVCPLVLEHARLSDATTALTIADYGAADCRASASLVDELLSQQEEGRSFRYICQDLPGFVRLFRIVRTVFVVPHSLSTGNLRCLTCCHRKTLTLSHMRTTTTHIHISNDWDAAARELRDFGTLVPLDTYNDGHKDSSHDAAVTLLSAPGNFYDRVMPTSTVDVALSNIAFHWLSAANDLPLPESEANASVHPIFKPTSAWANAWRERARDDWRCIVRRRADELRPGGIFFSYGMFCSSLSGIKNIIVKQATVQ